MKCTIHGSSAVLSKAGSIKAIAWAENVWREEDGKSVWREYHFDTNFTTLTSFTDYDTLADWKLAHEG